MPEAALEQERQPRHPTQSPLVKMAILAWVRCRDNKDSIFRQIGVQGHLSAQNIEHPVEIILDQKADNPDSKLRLSVRMDGPDRMKEFFHESARQSVGPRAKFLTYRTFCQYAIGLSDV